MSYTPTCIIIKVTHDSNKECGYNIISNYLLCSLTEEIGKLKNMVKRQEKNKQKLNTYEKFMESVVELSDEVCNYHMYTCVMSQSSECVAQY